MKKDLKRDDERFLGTIIIIVTIILWLYGVLK